MSQWASDKTGWKPRSSAAQSHIVGGASGFTGGAGKKGSPTMPKNDPPAGFHGRSSASTSHFASGPTKKMGSKLK